MTDEQFEKMYAVEVAKLAVMNGILEQLIQHNASSDPIYWDSIGELLAKATIAAKSPQS